MEKILHTAQFIDCYYPVIDGVVTVVDNYARRLNSEKSSSVVVTSKAIGFDDSKLSYPVIRCEALNYKKNIYGLPLPVFDLPFRLETDSLPLDIVHCHSPASVGKYGLTLAKEKDIPSIITFHSKFYDNILKVVRLDGLTKLPMAYVIDAFNRADFVWAVSEGSGEVLRSYGYKGEYEVVENGCEMKEHIFSEEEKKAFDEKYGIKDDETVFLFVGQIINHKNVKFSLDALNELKKQGMKFKFLLAGTGYNYNEIVDHAKNIGLDEALFIGKVSDREELSRLYSRADLFLFPSCYDNAPLVVMEAASCKTPAVVMKGSTAAERIIDGENGYITTDDVKYFAGKIKEAVGDKEKLVKVSQKASETVGRSFDSVVDEVYDRYKECIKLYKYKTAISVNL